MSWPELTDWSNITCWFFLTWSADLADQLIFRFFLKNWFFWNFDFFVDFLKFWYVMLLFRSRSIVNWSFRQMLDYPEPKYYQLIFHPDPILMSRFELNWIFWNFEILCYFIAKAEVLSTDLSDKCLIILSWRIIN